VASVAALIPDLLFGSNALALLRAGGHDAVLISSPDQLTANADVLVVDLTADASERLAQLEATDIGRARKLGVYAHVEGDVRRAAEAAGFDVVVPRSRFMREGADLVSRLHALNE
jgi:hypothetical protein